MLIKSNASHSFIRSLSLYLTLFGFWSVCEAEEKEKDTTAFFSSAFIPWLVYLWFSFFSMQKFIYFPMLRIHLSAIQSGEYIGFIAYKMHRQTLFYDLILAYIRISPPLTHMHIRTPKLLCLHYKNMLGRKALCLPLYWVLKQNAICLLIISIKISTATATMLHTCIIYCVQFLSVCSRKSRLPQSSTPKKRYSEIGERKCALCDQRVRYNFVGF